MTVPAALQPDADTSNALMRFRKLGARLMMLGVACGLLSVPLMRLDHWLASDVRSSDLPGDLRKAVELSEAFAHASGVTAILLGILLATWPPRPALWLTIAMTTASGVLANLMKVFFSRARPYTYDTQGDLAATDVTGWEFLGSGSFWDASQRSFPSGHTATAWALALGLSLMYPRATGLFLFLACLATFQRLYGGAHFPSDALAGIGIACVVCGAILFAASTRMPPAKPTPIEGAGTEGLPES